jgi:large subunit ribosomal protein L13
MNTQVTQKSSWLTKEAGEAQREWYVVDATGHTLGRLASRIAMVLRGKHKATYTPNVDMGDFVIVLNADKVKVTGRKAEQKMYFHHTGYMGHERYTPYGTMIAKHPERVIEKAVYGMLPKTALGRQVLRRKLRVYATAEHPHVAQQPTTLTFDKSEK